MSDGGDDGEALSLERPVVLLGRQQLLRKQRDWALNTVVWALKENGANCKLRRISVHEELLRYVWVRQLRARAECAFKALEYGELGGV